MNNFDLQRAIRVIGEDVTEWANYQDYSDDFHPFSNQDLSFLDTPEKRKEHFQEFFARTGLRRTGSISVPLHQNFTFGNIENQIEIKENRYSVVIQKWVRGMLTRSKFGVHNPNCENGKAFLMAMIRSQINTN